MIFKHQLSQLALRVLLLTGNLLLFAYAIVSLHFPALSLLLALVAIWQTVALYRFLSQHFVVIERYLRTLHYGESLTELELGATSTSLNALKATIDKVNLQYQQDKKLLHQQLNYLTLLTEHMPLPVLSIAEDNSVALINNAAVQLFEQQPPSTVFDFKGYGESFYQGMSALIPGNKALLRLETHGVSSQLMANCSEITTNDQRLTIVCLQNIQHQLDDAQLQSWQKLVRVLTHEMMNSLTPISSLSHTINTMVKDCINQLKNIAAEQNSELREELEDIYQASATVEKRANGLSGFVQNYRNIAHSPSPNMTELSLSLLFTEIKRLFEAQQQWQAITLTISCTEQLSINADEELIKQVLINLVTNAAQALIADDITHPQIALSVAVESGKTIQVIVDDNGLGVESDNESEIFLPFFTTKATGSGIGLALARQIMLAHHGRISYARSPLGGARFALTFADNK